MQTNLSEKIQQCRDGVYNNPYQGKDKRVVFICSMGILRSATGARLYAPKYNTRTCGTWDDALIPLTAELVEWADELVFVNKENYEGALGNLKLSYWTDVIKQKAKVLNIPDSYPHMHPKLLEAFKIQYEPIT